MSLVSVKLKYPTGLICRKLPQGLEQSLFARWSVNTAASLTSATSFLVVFAIPYQPKLVAHFHHRRIHGRRSETISWQVLHSPAGWLLIFILLRNNYILLYTIQLLPALGNMSRRPRLSPPLHPQTVVQLLTRTRHNAGLQKYLSYKKRRSDNLICFRCDSEVRSQAANLNLLFVFVCWGKKDKMQLFPFILWTGPQTVPRHKYINEVSDLRLSASMENPYMCLPHARLQGRLNQSSLLLTSSCLGSDVSRTGLTGSRLKQSTVAGQEDSS